MWSRNYACQNCLFATKAFGTEIITYDDIQSAAVAGQKRKALKELEPTKPNSKAQRKAKREKERQRAAAAAAEETRTPEVVPDPAETPCTRGKTIVTESITLYVRRRADQYR